MNRARGNDIKKIRDIVNDVKDNIYGRACYEQGNLVVLGEAVLSAGDGDYIEIGTLFGGSAIVAAMVKKAFGIRGDVYCIDPLNGYYIDGGRDDNVDPVSAVPVTPEVLIRNFDTFAVTDRLKIIQKKSQPFPHEHLHTDIFSVGYIDGCHCGYTPFLDFYEMSKYVYGYILFDNYDNDHPDVIKAVEQLEILTNWKTALVDGVVCVVEEKNEHTRF